MVFLFTFLGWFFCHVLTLHEEKNRNIFVRYCSQLVSIFPSKFYLHTLKNSNFDFLGRQHLFFHLLFLFSLSKIHLLFFQFSLKITLYLMKSESLRQTPRKIDKWGVDNIHIFVFCTINFFLKLIVFTLCEHEYMNISPPLIDLLRSLQVNLNNTT